jgi:hypothetical protein
MKSHGWVATNSFNPKPSEPRTDLDPTPRPISKPLSLPYLRRMTDATAVAINPAAGRRDGGRAVYGVRAF